MSIFRDFDRRWVTRENLLMTCGIEFQMQRGSHTWQFSLISFNRTKQILTQQLLLDSDKLRERMVQRLEQEGLLHSPGVIAAMRTVPRELFLPENLRANAYDDLPLPTGHGQTISAPHGAIHRALHGRDHE